MQHLFTHLLRKAQLLLLVQLSQKHTSQIDICHYFTSYFVWITRCFVVIMLKIFLFLTMKILRGVASRENVQSLTTCLVFCTTHNAVDAKYIVWEQQTKRRLIIASNIDVGVSTLIIFFLWSNFVLSQCCLSRYLWASWQQRSAPGDIRATLWVSFFLLSYSFLSDPNQLLSGCTL